MAQEHSCYTWDPVTRAWVHERGAEIAPPPVPPDVHALQSYFYDEESKQWIRTVLAPLGRELAAKWEGAHKIPDEALANPKPAKRGAPAKKKGSAGPLVAVAVVLLVLLGGAGVVASQSGLLGQVPATVPKVAASLTAAASVAPTASPEPSPSPSPSPPTAPAGGGGGAATPRPPAPPAGATVTQPPNSSQVRLPDGTTVYYNGPTLVLRGQQLPASLVVATANNRAASGVITVILGDQRGSTQAQGGIDAQGHAVLQVLASQPSGQYPLSVLFNNQIGQVALITVR